MYYPVGQKFARNRSISYGFRNIHTFSFSAKIQDGRQKRRKFKFFLCIRYFCTTLRVKNSLEIALSLTVFDIFTLFHFPLKSKMAAKVAKIEIFPLCKGYSLLPCGSKIFPLCKRYSCTTLWVKNSLEIALSCTVFKIFTLFHFPLKSKSGEN